MTNRNGVLVGSSIPRRNGTVTPIHFTNRNAVPANFEPFSQPQLRRSVRLQSKFQPEYRFSSKTTLWQERAIREADEDEERRNYVPFIQQTAPKTITRETTVDRELGVIEAANVIASGIDSDTYHPRNPREVRKHDLVTKTDNSPQHTQPALEFFPIRCPIGRLGRPGRVRQHDNNMVAPCLSR